MRMLKRGDTVRFDRTMASPTHRGDGSQCAWRKPGPGWWSRSPEAAAEKADEEAVEEGPREAEERKKAQERRRVPMHLAGTRYG